MKAWTIPVIVMLSLLFLVNSGSALTDVDACQTLSSAGETYVLNASIDDSTSSTCFQFTADNITLDCDGFTINATNAPVVVFSFGSQANIVVKNCIIYAQNTDTNVLVFTSGVSNLTYQDNVAYVGGQAWYGNENDNLVNIIGNYFNQTCYHETAYEPSSRFTGQYVNFDGNVFDAYCENETTSGVNTFEKLNYSVVKNSVFTVAGSAYEPLTFHQLHGNLIDNITIDSTNLQYANSGMTGRFCCGTDNIFRNSRMYLNQTFNIYAPNYLGNNITWDNIQMDSTGDPLTMSITDYDNISIKNSIFTGINFDVDKSSSYLVNILHNILLYNITSDGSAVFSNANAEDSWNLTNSHISAGVSLVNVSNAFLLKSSILDYGSGNNLALDSDSDYNTIYDNTFDTGDVVDSGTDNVYCVGSVGNTYTGGSAYTGSSLGTCFTPYMNVSACQTLSDSDKIYLLTTDLYGQVGSCIRIDGTNVTFDCQNHLIEGDGTGSSDKGVYITSAGNVTIQNCIINHFATGVRFPFLAGTSTDNIVLRNIQTTNNYTSGTVYGVYTANSTNVLIDNVTITNSSTSTGSRYGIYLDANSDSIVKNSRFYGLSIGVYYPSYAIDMLVQDNEFINMTQFGFRFPSTANILNATLDGNSFSGNLLYNIFYSTSIITPALCEQMTITGNTGKGGLPILFYNTAGQTIENHVNDVADIMLCNSSGSVIRNVFCDNTCENFHFLYADNLDIDNVTLIGYNQFNVYKSLGVVTLDDVSLYNCSNTVFTCSANSCSLTNSIISSIAPFRTGSGSNVLFGGYLYNTTTPMEFNLTNSLIEGYNLPTPTSLYSTAINTFNYYRANIVNSILRGNHTAFMVSNTSGNVTIISSTLSRLSADTAYADFKSFGNLADGSRYDFYNVTFSTYNITSNSVLNVYWKLAINNAFGANVVVKDNNSATLLTTSTSFDYWAKEYNVTATNVKTDEPTKMITLDLSKTGYTPISVSFEMTENWAYTISLTSSSFISSLPDIFVQLVLTLGFGIIAIFACLTLIVSKEDANVLYQPENFIKLIIAVVIVILMLVGVWMGLVI